MMEMLQLSVVVRKEQKNDVAIAVYKIQWQQLNQQHSLMAPWQDTGHIKWMMWKKIRLRKFVL